jgi:hypothetical protein
LHPVQRRQTITALLTLFVLSTPIAPWLSGLVAVAVGWAFVTPLYNIFFRSPSR